MTQQLVPSWSENCPITLEMMMVNSTANWLNDHIWPVILCNLDADPDTNRMTLPILALLILTPTSSSSSLTLNLDPPGCGVQTPSLQIPGPGPRVLLPADLRLLQLPSGAASSAPRPSAGGSTSGGSFSSQNSSFAQNFHKIVFFPFCLFVILTLSDHSSN